jgi:hypothetical protein
MTWHFTSQLGCEYLLYISNKKFQPAMQQQSPGAPTTAQESTFSHIINSARRSHDYIGKRRHAETMGDE